MVRFRNIIVKNISSSTAQTIRRSNDRWSSPAHYILVSKPIGTHDNVLHIYVIVVGGALFNEKRGLTTTDPPPPISSADVTRGCTHFTLPFL